MKRRFTFVSLYRLKDAKNYEREIMDALKVDSSEENIKEQSEFLCLTFIRGQTWEGWKNTNFTQS